MADDLEKKQEKQPDNRLKKLKSDFVSDFRSEKTWRKAKEEWGDFYDGDQLSAEEKRELEKRGQPPVVINRIKPKLDAIFGTYEQLRVDTKVYPAGFDEEQMEKMEEEQKAPLEVQVAFVSEEIRRVEDDSEFDEEEELAFEDICIDGRAWYKIFKEYDGINGIDKVKYIDNEKVVLDRFCSSEDRRTGDLKTCKRIHETVWMDYEDAVETFPKFKDEIEQAIQNPAMGEPMLAEKLREYNPDQYKEPGDNEAIGDSDLYGFNTFIDKKRKRLRIVTTFFRTPDVRVWIKGPGAPVDVTEMPEGERAKILENLEGSVSWTENNYKMNSSTFIWNIIIEEKKDIRAYDKYGKFPLVMVPGYVSRNKDKCPYGIVKQHIDPQKEVNKRRSKMLHLLNVNQTWFEDGAFENETKTRAEIARPDGFIKYNKQFKVDQVKHGELAQAQFQLLQESKAEIDQSGTRPELEGQSKATSGRDFQLRQQAALQSIRKLFSNMRKARKRVAYYLIDEILYRNRGLTLKKYDIVVEEAPDTTNLMQETFTELSKLAQSGVPVPPDMLVELSPLEPSKKREFIQKMQAQQQMQAQMMAQGQQAPPNGRGMQ